MTHVLVQVRFLLELHEVALPTQVRYFGIRNLLYSHYIGCYPEVCFILVLRHLEQALGHAYELGFRLSILDKGI